MTELNSGRRVVATMNLSLDGHYARPDGTDMSWVMPYALTEVARNHMASICTSSTTALLGRVNAEGFMGYWPSVIHMDVADARDVVFARWLVESEKVVLSSTLQEAPWERTTVLNQPAIDVVSNLMRQPGGDIAIFSSASVIKPLLAAGMVDRLALGILPIFLGSGPRLFDDGLPATSWTLVSQATGEQGMLALVYDRVA